jgi:hypothetical protein
MTVIYSFKYAGNLLEIDMVKEEHCTLFIPNYSPQNFYNTHSPLRILLAEDDFEMRKMLSWYLQKKGCNVIASKNGDDLMRHLGFLEPSENFNELKRPLICPGAWELRPYSPNLSIWMTSLP